MEGEKIVVEVEGENPFEEFNSGKHFSGFSSFFF